MENLYKGPERFGELSNDLVVFRFSFFTLATQLSLSHRGGGVILSRCRIGGRGVASTVFAISYSLQ